MYLQPDSTLEACEILASRRCQIVSGATDLYARPRESGAELAMLDISKIWALRGIAIGSDHIRIGATTRWSEIRDADLPPALHALQMAAREIGSIQIQSRGTLGGNLCNASPAADGIPPLLVANAEVELVSNKGVRQLGLPEFLLADGGTAIQQEELLHSIIIPHASADTVSAYAKLGLRRDMVISVLVVAVVLRRAEDGRVRDVRIAVGAASKAALRLRKLEDRLIGTVLPAHSVVVEEDVSDLTPIDDVRGSADYRRRAAVVLLNRTLNQAANGVRDTGSDACA